MSLKDNIINQSKIDAALLCESSDISYKSVVESAQQTRSKSKIKPAPLNVSWILKAAAQKSSIQLSSQAAFRN